MTSAPAPESLCGAPNLPGCSWCTSSWGIGVCIPLVQPTTIRMTMPGDGLPTTFSRSASVVLRAPSRTPCARPVRHLPPRPPSRPPPGRAGRGWPGRGARRCARRPAGSPATGADADGVQRPPTDPRGGPGADGPVGAHGGAPVARPAVPRPEPTRTGCSAPRRTTRRGTSPRAHGAGPGSSPPPWEGQPEAGSSRPPGARGSRPGPARRRRRCRWSPRWCRPPTGGR